MLTCHHVGYLVKSMNKSIGAFETLGYSVVRPPAEDGIRRALIAFMQKDGIRIELIQPMDRESPVYGLLKHYKNAPYHLCYETDDFDGDLCRLEAEGFTRFTETQPAPCMGNRNVVFLMNAAIGMIELYDKELFGI